MFTGCKTADKGEPGLASHSAVAADGCRSKNLNLIRCEI